MPLTETTSRNQSLGIEEPRRDQLHAELGATIAASELRLERQLHERLSTLEHRIDNRLARLDSRIGRLEHRLT